MFVCVCLFTSIDWSLACLFACFVTCLTDVVFLVCVSFGSVCSLACLCCCLFGCLFIVVLAVCVV